MATWPGMTTALFVRFREREPLKDVEGWRPTAVGCNQPRGRPDVAEGPDDVAVVDGRAVMDERRASRWMDMVARSTTR